MYQATVLPELSSQSQQAANVSEGTFQASEYFNLSSTFELQNIKRSMSTLPSIRADKVALLREAISSGNYYVETSQLAKKLVNDILSDALLKKIRGSRQQAVIN